jgi:hypothetical protein
MTDPAMARNMFLRKFFVQPPIIFECFSGVGADTITFLYDLNPKVIYTVQHAMQKASYEEVRAYVSLQGNIQNFIAAVPDIRDDVVQYSPDSVQSFIAKQSDFPSIDLLYLDPPWRLDGVNECTAEQMVAFLDETVFSPLKQKNIVPRVICIKTRFGRADIEKIHDSFPVYRLDTCLKCQPTNKIFYFHIFALKDVVDAVYQRSDVFNVIYDTGKRLRKPEESGASSTVANTDQYPYQRGGAQQGDGALPKFQMVI